jgi:hypothetical protein
MLRPLQHVRPGHMARRDSYATGIDPLSGPARRTPNFLDNIWLRDLKVTYPYTRFALGVKRVPSSI